MLRLPFTAWYILSREAGLESDHGDINLILVFKKKSDGQFELIPAKTEVKQLSCRRESTVCF